VLTGFRFDTLDCVTGDRSTVGQCEFSVGAQDNQVAVIEPLRAGEGITVNGAIASLVSPVLPEPPPPPDPISGGFQPLGLVMLPLGLLAAVAVYLIGRSAGSNTVHAGGAVEAAFGDLPLPGQRARRTDVGTFRVPDSRLAEMATIEFVPPRGLEPWQAAVVLRESVDNDSVAAWFAEMIADGALTASEVDGKVRLTPGSDTGRLSSIDQGHLHRLFATDDVIELGTYDPEFTATWT
jgi:hypothetical protein